MNLKAPETDFGDEFFDALYEEPKRFKKTGTGKLVRNKAYKSHILTKKSQKRKRNLRKATVVDSTNVKSMKKALPYL